VRAVVQRVSQASVAVGGRVVGAIGEPGLLVLVGVTHQDTQPTAAKLAAKLWGLRILEGEKSCSDVAAPLLIVSQFTLYADTRKGRRPTWQAAAPGPVAEPLVDAHEALARLGSPVSFGPTAVLTFDDGTSASTNNENEWGRRLKDLGYGKS